MPILEEKQRLAAVEQRVTIEVGGSQLRGILTVPEDAFGLVLLSAGSDGRRGGGESDCVARELEVQGLAVLHFDLLSPEEAEDDARTGRVRTDILRLSSRWLGAAEWAASQQELRDFPLGFSSFGVAAPAALSAAAERPPSLAAVVCRDGRVDLAGSSLADVRVPTLLLVEADDDPLVRANEAALLRLGYPLKELILIPHDSRASTRLAGHGAVAELTADWLGARLIQMA